MKLLLAVLTVFTSCFCLAASPSENPEMDVCATIIPCGIYEGSGNWYDVNNVKKSNEDFGERISITPLTKTSVNLKVVFLMNGSAERTWANATLSFEPTGRFTVSAPEGGGIFGSGFCQNKVCTVAFRPVHIDDQMPSYVNSFVNILRFENNKLKRFNMVADGTNDEALRFQRSELTLKP